MCEKGNGWERGRNREIPPSMRRKLWFSDWVYLGDLMTIGSIQFKDNLFFSLAHISEEGDSSYSLVQRR